MWLRSEVARRYVESLGLTSLLCLFFLGFRVQVTGTARYWFIPENLALAWAGLFFGWALVNQLKVRRWLSWQNISLSLAWIIFLPNTWYVLTDFLHVYPTGEISELFDIVLIATLVLTGFALGLTSLFLVHKELTRRLTPLKSWAAVGAVILLSSFAIYLGRVLRWNSWDFVTNPSGLIINVSDRLSDPVNHLHAWNVTGLFFALIGVIYVAFWRAMSLFNTSKMDH